MKVNTSNLKSMLGRVSSCKPTNLLEITNYYELEFTEEGLNLNVTDGANYMTVTDTECTTEKPVNIIVKSDQFTKLINKTTTDTVDLIVKDSYLEVKGNGVYKVEIVQDEVYPKMTVDGGDSYKVSLTELKKAINGGKYAKSSVPNDGVLFSYLIRSGEVTTADAIKVYSKVVDGKLNGINVLIPPTLANMILALDLEDVDIVVSKDNTLIMFIGKDVVVCGAVTDGVEDYPDLSEMFQVPYPYSANIDVPQVLQAIDRLGLFISLYDKGIIDLVFTNNSLTIATSSKSHETINYIQPIDGDVTFMTRVNCKYLQDLFNAVGEPEVLVDFGADDVLRFSTLDVNMLLAIADEE